MIPRNSLKSVLRSPVKTILFFILLLSLTTALTLGSALVGMCSLLIEECRRTYITTASIEYKGGNYPNKSVVDETANAIRSKIDFDALSKLPFVEKTDRNASAVIAVDNYPWHVTDSSANNVFVGVVSIPGSTGAGKAEYVLYADTIIDNNAVRLNPKLGVDFRFYLITGFTDGTVAGIREITVGNIVNKVGSGLGAVQEYNMIDVTDDPHLENGDPRYTFFFTAAKIYKTINSSAYAAVSKDPGFLEPFVEKDYTFKEGRIYTEADTKDTACCILPVNIAGPLKVSAGDKIKLTVTSTGFCRIIDSYWADEKTVDDAKVIECLVTGIFSTTAKEDPPVYISDLRGIAEEGEIGGFCGYTLGTLKIKNGTSERDLERLKSMLPEGAELSVRDQGYSVIVGLLNKLKGDAAGITAAAFVAALAMIILFAYVFVGRQSDALVTMYMMGTPKKLLRVYVAVSAVAVLIPAGVIGGFAAFGFSDILVLFISKTLSSSESILRLYSSSGLGTVSVIDVNISMPAWIGVLCGAAVIALGLGACLVFLRKALKTVGAKPKTEKKKKTKLPGNAKPLKLSGAGLKYFIISTVRGGLRSAALPLVGLLMTVFVLAPAAAITVYENQKKELDETTHIKGYLTDYAGKKSYDLVFTDNMIEKLAEGEYFSDFHFSLNDPYRVYSVERKKSPSDETGEVEIIAKSEVPQGGFVHENFITNLLNGPKMFYTDSVGTTPEFLSASDPEITYLEGYDESWFLKNTLPFSEAKFIQYSGVSPIFDFKEDERELCVAVPEPFLEKYNLKLGDYVTLDISSDVVREKYLIIGSFRPASSGDTLYTRIENSHKKVKYDIDRIGNPVYGAKIRTSYSSCTFRLTNTANIKDAKEWLREEGFSRVHSAGFYRLYPVLVDGDYCESLEKIEKNIGYLKNVVPALSALVGLSGIAAAVLMAYRRRVEIATLRSIGQRDLSVFFMFLCEQALPAVLGSAAAFGGFAIFAGINIYSVFAVSFIGGFAAGSLASLFKMSKTNLLDVLSDKE